MNKINLMTKNIQTLESDKSKYLRARKKEKKERKNQPKWWTKIDWPEKELIQQYPTSRLPHEIMDSTEANKENKEQKKRKNQPHRWTQIDGPEKELIQQLAKN